MASLDECTQLSSFVPLVKLFLASSGHLDHLSSSLHIFIYSNDFNEKRNEKHKLRKEIRIVQAKEPNLLQINNINLT